MHDLRAQSENDSPGISSDGFGWFVVAEAVALVQEKLPLVAICIKIDEFCIKNDEFCI